MAERPVFVSPPTASLVWTHQIDFPWFAGMSVKQAQKSIDSLHEAAKERLSVRAKVEHPFRVIERQFSYAKVRYRGLGKNTARLTMLFALSNLWMVHRQLMGPRDECARDAGVEVHSLDFGDLEDISATGTPPIFKSRN